MQGNRSDHKPHIVVVDPARFLPETDCFNAISHYSSLAATYHLPAMFGPGSLERELDAVANVAGIIVLGSAASVYDNQPWQSHLERWLKPLIAAKIPVLGICYGHQMLARMFGGKVDYLNSSHAKLKGFYKVEMKSSRIWIAGPRTLVRSHCEHVTICPPDFDVIATSKEVLVDAIQHKTLPIWGIQAHPEATSEFLKAHEIQAGQSLEGSLLDGTRLTFDFIDYVTNCSK